MEKNSCEQIKSGAAVLPNASGFLILTTKWDELLTKLKAAGWKEAVVVLDKTEGDPLVKLKPETLSPPSASYVLYNSVDDLVEYFKGEFLAPERPVPEEVTFGALQVPRRSNPGDAGVPAAQDPNRAVKTGPYSYDEILRDPSLFEALLTDRGRYANALVPFIALIHQSKGAHPVEKKVYYTRLFTELEHHEGLVPRTTEGEELHALSQYVRREYLPKLPETFQVLTSSVAIVLQVIISDEFRDKGNKAFIQNEELDLGTSHSVPKEGVFREILDAFVRKFGKWCSTGSKTLWDFEDFNDVVKMLQEALSLMVPYGKKAGTEKLDEFGVQWNKFVVQVKEVDKAIMRLIYGDMYHRMGSPGGLPDGFESFSLGKAVNKLEEVYSTTFSRKNPHHNALSKPNPPYEYPEWKGAFAEDFRERFLRQEGLKEVDLTVMAVDEDSDCEPPVKRRRLEKVVDRRRKSHGRGGNRLDRRDDRRDRDRRSNRMKEKDYVVLGWKKEDIKWHNDHRCHRVKGEAWNHEDNKALREKTEKEYSRRG